VTEELINVLPIILIALVLWLIGLSLVFTKIMLHYRKLAAKANEGDLVTAMETLLKDEEKHEGDIERIYKRLAEHENKAATYFQKHTLLRYNPFNETGGAQSFCLCLLDRDDNGVIITGLHTRDRTRVYTKPVLNGKSETELSREEKKVLLDTQKQ